MGDMLQLLGRSFALLGWHGAARCKELWEKYVDGYLKSSQGSSRGRFASAEKWIPRFTRDGMAQCDVEKRWTVAVLVGMLFLGGGCS